MTQAGDGSIWQVNLPQTIGSIANPYADCSELAALPTGQSTLESFYTSLARCDPHTMEALKAQHKRAPTAATAAAVGAAADVVAVEAAAPAKNLELTAVSAAVPMPTPTATPSHRRKHQHQHHNNNNNTKHNHHSGGQSSRSAQRQQAARQFVPTGNYMEDYACCYDLYQNALSPLDERRHQRPRGPALRCLIAVYRCIMRVCSWIRRYIKRLVEHKYFQQGILLAILINTLSMGIEYHDQPEELTAIVETSNIVFSGIFAVEMLLKVVAEGPFRYIANGFNVFDGIIVILSAIEICQQFLGNGTGGGGSGLSVLRTFRLLRILKLVRFMPNLRRQLFVMLRTMDNVAVFFSLLVLFIFIFSILGMYLFGGKFCKFLDESGLERECTCPEIISRHPQCECDRKHFNNILWATVTVFQILTQEDWNVVLFNGMEKTSHWAALYFVALMTFGNYVLFNLLVAILVEGFSSERNERREREQRELVKKLREETLAENYSDGMYDESRSEADSSTTNDSYYEVRNRWRSAEDVRKLQDSAELIIEAKSNMHRQRLLQPMQDYQINELPQQQAGSSGGASSNDKEASGKLLSHDDQAKPRGGLKKTYSIKDRRSDAPRLSKMRLVRDPPMITTTAATPQDSPSTTLEPGMSFRQWGDTLEPPSSPSPSLLKPPNIFSGGQRVLDEGIPSIDLIPPSPVLAHKPLNILNASQLQGHTPSHSLSAGSAGSSSSGIIVGDVAGGSSSLSSVIIDDISKNSGTAAAATPTPIYVPTMLQPPADLNLSELSLAGGASTSGSSSSERLTPLTPTTIATSPPPLTNASGFKQRFRRSSSKKRTRAQQHEQEELNNGKDTNRLSPQNSIRRLSNTLSIGSVGGVGGGVGSRRASACIFNSQVYQNLNQAPKLKAGAGQRRMSSIELAFSKTSHLNLHNLEANRKSLSYTNSKIDLDKWQKGSEPDMLQQYMEARDKRKNSISHYNLKKRLEEKELQQLQLLHQQQQQLEAAASQSHLPPQQLTKELHQLQQQQLQQEQQQQLQQQQQQPHSMLQTSGGGDNMSKLKMLITRLTPKHFTDERESYSMYIFPEDNRFRQICTWFVNQKWFDNVVLLFIALNCITLAMERPNIPPSSTERLFLSTANYVFTVVFTVEMFIKVVATGMFYGPDAYFTSGWNIMDGSLVTISIIDLLMSLISESSPKIFGILRVFRLLRSLRPLRVINRAPGLKLVVQTLLSSLRPIGNIVLICCTFFIIFGILGVQLFKGTFFYCEGEHIKNVRNRRECESIPGNVWTNRKYNFDDLGKALMSLFVLSSRDGWVNIMYTGLDAVGVDQQPIVNYNEWRLLYFIAFILLVGFFVLNMFVGVVVENFHRCREEQEKEEKIRRAAKRALQMEKKRRRMHEPPYYTNYSPTRMFVHNVVTSKYFDLAIAAVIGLNVVTMAMEYYKMPNPLKYALKIFNYFFTAVFILEANMKLVALGWHLYLKDRWNQLDVGIVLLSIVGIVLEELETNIIPINPTIIRVMRVLRIARVLKLLKMAKGIRALLDTVMQALPQVGNLGLLFFLLFFIFAALGVELFGRLECSDEIPCQGLGEHAHFANFGMAFLTLFRVATGDNWNGIMKDTLRDNCDDAADCVRNCCVSSIIAPIFFVIFVLMAQFVLVNVVVAVLMKHLEESHKQMEDELDMEVELERELVREQEFAQEQKLCQQLAEQAQSVEAPTTSTTAAATSTAAAATSSTAGGSAAGSSNTPRPLAKVKSLPKNFIYSTPALDKKSLSLTLCSSFNTQRRQTLQYLQQQQQHQGIQGLNLAELGTVNAAAALQRRTRRASAAGSGFRRRGILAKERSLDEQAIRRRNLETKRTSCDSLALDYRRGTIFESMESDAPSSNSYDLDVRSIRSAELPPTAPPLAVVSALVTPTPSTVSSVSAPPPTRRPFGWSQSVDQGCMRSSLLLSVPRSMPPRSRSGSTKQLFKQQALDEDADMDESSLLLPSVSSAAATPPLPPPAAAAAAVVPTDGPASIVAKSDSADILRIISERRRMDQRDQCGNEDSDYNELLLVKSPQSSTE
ncbi:voltage-dependent T-type calcium channel subunit alpha-1G isoform X5 [Drosophila busckii]|uniref:voltage-dependent T-type calcium channel subunit alpha-1G isoform X5 n=1 Tax=Drosophila busckii TaxID=30019 RepID=UPI0014331888|nr:voltage-dependent T-type calcium channel subunit alpha-1G isoform X5 [Drosophila busckii]